MQIQKEYVWGFYIFLCAVLSVTGYIFPTKNKVEYSMLFLLFGILLSLILWVTWGSKNTY